MKQIYMMAYFILLGTSIKSANIAFIIASILIGFIILAIIPIIKNIKIKNTQELLKKIDEEKLKPFININSAPWYILNELPVLNKVQAKKIVYLRKHFGLYTSKDDFYRKNNLTEKEINILDKIIFLG